MSNTFPGMNAAGSGKRASVISGLSGNEMYCVDLLGYHPGNLLVGNSVFSLGLLGGLTASFRGAVGGEVTEVTDIISQGRHLSMQRLVGEMGTHRSHGATGVTSELIFHNGNIEFLSTASSLHQKEGAPAQSFLTAADGQELLCQVDAGYDPISFVMGNVAYSIGAARSVTGLFRQLGRGEVRQYSDLFNQTRHLALERIAAEAASIGANAVIGIKTSLLPFGVGTPIQEMLMVGTASRYSMTDPAFENLGVITSDLTAEETWNLAKIGYSPMRLVLGTSVYSLGLVGGIAASLRNLVRGEIKELTDIIYGARENSLAKLQEQATAVGADDVLGVKTYIYDIGGGLVEFLAIGTAVKRNPDAKTKMEQLPPQAITQNKKTFFNAAEISYGMQLTS